MHAALHRRAGLIKCSSLFLISRPRRQLQARWLGLRDIRLWRPHRYLRPSRRHCFIRPRKSCCLSGPNSRRRTALNSRCLSGPNGRRRTALNRRRLSGPNGRRSCSVLLGASRRRETRLWWCDLLLHRSLYLHACTIVRLGLRSRCRRDANVVARNDPAPDIALGTEPFGIGVRRRGTVVCNRPLVHHKVHA
jgi:hypothetical protein